MDVLFEPIRRDIYNALLTGNITELDKLTLDLSQSRLYDLLEGCSIKHVTTFNLYIKHNCGFTNNHYNIFKYLLDRGANPNYENYSMESILYYNIVYGELNIVKLILVYGGKFSRYEISNMKMFNIKNIKDMPKIETSKQEEKCDFYNSVQNWSRFKVACNFMEVDEIIDLYQREIIQPDFITETKQSLISVSHSDEVKELVKSYYNGWKPHTHHIFKKETRIKVHLMMIITNRFEEYGPLWLPNELWLYIYNLVC